MCTEIVKLKKRIILHVLHVVMAFILIITSILLHKFYSTAVLFEWFLVLVFIVVSTTPISTFLTARLHIQCRMIESIKSFDGHRR